MKHGIILMTPDNTLTEQLTADQNILLKSFAAPTPAPKTYTAEIDGRDGTIDYTDYFGNVKYKNRTVTATVNLAKAFNKIKMKEYHSYLMNVWHGQKVKLYYWGQPDRYYYGRLTIGDITQKDGTVALSLDAEPYAYAISERNYTVTATGTETLLQVTNIGKAISPRLIVDGEIDIRVNGNSYSLTTGEYQIIDIQLNRVGTTDIFYAGGGTLQVIYQERVL